MSKFDEKEMIIISVIVLIFWPFMMIERLITQTFSKEQNEMNHDAPLEKESEIKI
jgi:hypothetical protein